MEEFKLGDYVQDRLTGFAGLILVKVEYLYGETRYGVQPQQLCSDGTTIPVEYFNGTQLIFVSLVQDDLGFIPSSGKAMEDE